mmetsp:Transcript_17766/g.26817  ORF Transcript_17766/g.26817 Transcript_17766/m.26817 type:complete len:271 (+) Transcript_17766:62-874(+)
MRLPSVFFSVALIICWVQQCCSMKSFLAPSQASNPAIPVAKVGILWDIDGTLADSYKHLLRCTNEVLQTAGREPVDEDTFNANPYNTTPMRFSWHLDNTCTAVTPEGEALGTKFDALYVSKVSPASVKFYPGLARTIQRLSKAGHPQGVVSNSVGAYARAVIQANGQWDSFEAMWGVDELPAPKPAPGGLLKCCRDLQCDPTTSVYVGDTPSDGQAAQAAGLASIGVTWGHTNLSAAELGPYFDQVVEDVPALAGALNGFCLAKVWPDGK